ncbi:aminoglycoside phosphotransferase family protein [Kocuria nitroreducens]|uniref:aminoglycoside phosphotransferase family protein n=1 Tax=Kocuria nitroreducens TaxID=3058914 RepID=UPI0036DE73AF
MPEVEVQPTAAQVRRLLEEQLPEEFRVLLDRPLSPVAQGWDNALFRLGPVHAVRLPVRRAAVPCLLREARWTAVAAAPLAALGIAVPRPVFRGRPGAGYPWPWTVVRWIEGEAVATLPPARRDRLAEDLARALASLHRPAPESAPRNPYRGVPLGARLRTAPPSWPATAAALGARRTERLRGIVDDGLRAAPWSRPPVWLHGDPHPWNLVHRDGRLAGLIDFGDVCAGDPASDLAGAWLAFDADQRSGFRALVDTTGRYDDDVWRRAAAWAALYVAALVAHPDTGPHFGAVVRHAVAQLVPGS